MDESETFLAKRISDVLRQAFFSFWRSGWKCFGGRPRDLGRLSSTRTNLEVSSIEAALKSPGAVLPYMGYIGMCRCEGYGFQAVYSSIGYINQSVWV